MEELHPAQKLADGLKEDLGTFAKLRGMTPEALMEEERKLDEQAWADGREREGPGAAEMDKVIGFVDQSNSARQWLGRFGLGWAYPALARSMGAPVLEKARAPMNHARMVDRLLEVHGHEIFVDGAFNGDPHPGNFLLVQPGNMIGLIDYGQVKVMTLEQRLVLARLIKALCDGDDEKIAAGMYEAGFRTKYQKQDVICKCVTGQLPATSPTATPASIPQPPPPPRNVTLQDGAALLRPQQQGLDRRPSCTALPREVAG